jgi:predicted RNA methylase
MSTILDEHIGYLDDSARLDRYRSAIAKTVKPGDLVADVGCGTAVLGLFCLQAGAGHVHAIDSTEAIEVARESLDRAGWADQATMHYGKSYRVSLPKLVDVLICDHVGYFGFDYGLVELLADSKARFLKPGGRIIPGRLRLQVSAIESEKCHSKAESWQQEDIPPEFHWVRKHSVNTKYAVTLSAEEVIAEPADLGTIDLREDNPSYFTWTARLRINREGVLHGIAGWFECELAEGVWMTNSPLNKEAIDRPQAFFPIDDTLNVAVGDEIAVNIMARPADHLIAWEVKHLASGKSFKHSTFHGDLLMKTQLDTANPLHIPQQSALARARSTILTYCDGKRTIAEIHAAVLRDHPALLPSTEEIRRFVTGVLVDSTA